MALLPQWVPNDWFQEYLKGKPGYFQKSLLKPWDIRGGKKTTKFDNQMFHRRAATHTRGADNSLDRPTSRCISFDSENISFDTSLFIYISSTNIPPVMIINRIYEYQNLLSLQLVSFLVGLRTYQHPCT